jgi:hypothetical protein
VRGSAPTSDIICPADRQTDRQTETETETETKRVRAEPGIGREGWGRAVGRGGGQSDGEADS